MATNEFVSLSASLSQLQNVVRKLLSHWSTLQQLKPFQIRSAHPWFPPAPAESQYSPYAQVISTHPISLPAHPGNTCRLLGNTLPELQPLSLYGFPLLVLQLISPDGATQTVEIEIPPFKTYAEGTHTIHVLEYAATCLDLDLQSHGFRARRLKKRLEIYAGQARAGWHIKVSELIHLPLPAHCQRCDLGLEAGMSTLDPEQTPGQSGKLCFGHYLLNGQRIDLHLAFSQTWLLPQIREALVLQFNQMTAKTGVHAQCDAHHHLILRHTQTGPEHTLEIKRLSDCAEPEIQTYELGLPEGVFMGQPLEEPAEIDLGAFKLNGQRCELGIMRIDSTQTWRQEFTQKLAQFSAQTQVQIWWDVEGYLNFQGTQIVLEPEGGDPWHLEPCDLRPATPDWQVLRPLFAEWLTIANQCLRLVAHHPLLKPLEIPLRQALLKNMPGQSGFQIRLTPETGFQLIFNFEVFMQNHIHLASAFQDFLQHLLKSLEALQNKLQQLQHTPPHSKQPPAASQPPLFPVILPEHRPVLPRVPASTHLDSPAEIQPSSFDHKI